MKHGISPTTDRRALKRRGKYIHVSKPLAIKETDWATGALKGIVSYDPDYLAPPSRGNAAQIRLLLPKLPLAKRAISP